MIKKLAACLTLLLGSVFCFPADGRADIYKYIDENGVVHFTNTPSHGKFRLVLKDKKGPQHSERRFDSIIKKLCRRYRVDTCLVKAVIKAESAFNPYAVSKKGAQGLMQLMPQKARELQVLDPFDPHENLQGGISYLRTLLDKFDGNLPLVLAAYNAGENAVLQHNSIPPFRETRNYIRKVLEFKNQYQNMY